MNHEVDKSVAIVGCGYWGKNLVRNFYELGALHTICDTRFEVLKELTEKYQSVKSTTELDNILNNPMITSVIISTPASTHYNIAKKAILSGKDIFVEKPLALNVTEGEELTELAKKNGRVLMVGHVLNYHPAVKMMKRMISDGLLGRIQYVYSNRLNFGKIRREENILWSFAPHDISVILNLLEEEPKEVSARGSYYLHPNIADVTMSQMEFASGINAHVFVSWLHPYKEQKLIIVGEKQMLVFDDTKSWGSKLVIYPHEVTWTKGVPEAKKAEGKAIRLEEQEPLKSECMCFLDSCRTRKKPITDGCEGIKVLKILNTLQDSLDEEREKIIKKQDKLIYYVHESAIVEKGAKIGKGTKIWHFSHVMPGAEIGERCNLGQNVVVLSDVKLGNNVKVQNNVSIYDRVVCEDDVFLGPSMVFTNVFNPRSHIPRKDEYQQTLVKKGATIGANTTIVCGNTINEYAFIGAGAVVTKDVPKYALIYGNPGKIKGWMCKCGLKLSLSVDDQSEKAVCRACGQSYERIAYSVEEI